MKYEWKKLEKKYYIPKTEPEFVEIPKFKFITISGRGNPNNEDFSRRVGILYSLAYSIKMMPKKGFVPEGYFDYAVYPLEGLWDLTEDGKKMDTINKDELIYKIMIRQPDFVDNNVFDKALSIAKSKKNDSLYDEASFEETEEGDCVQILHIGSYDTEKDSFDKMKKYITENNLKIETLIHREIYLSDARKVSKDKLKTVLRYRVNKK